MRTINAHPMTDLVEYNLRLARIHLGELGTTQRRYIEYAFTCFAHLLPSTQEIESFFQTHQNRRIVLPPIYANNVQYLTLARLMAKDVAAGVIGNLIIMGFDLMQAELLAQLTTNELNQLASEWGGLIYKTCFPGINFVNGLHEKVIPIHAAAYSHNTKETNVKAYSRKRVT